MAVSPGGHSSPTSKQKLPPVMAKVPKLDPEDFACPICRELAYKPIVNACGHVFCFWCVQQAMNPFAESYCPMCRRVFAHFPRICQLLHSFYTRAFALEYYERACDVEEDERERNVFSPSLGDASTHPPTASSQLAPEPPLNPPASQQAESGLTEETGIGEGEHMECLSRPLAVADVSSSADISMGESGAATRYSSARRDGQQGGVSVKEEATQQGREGDKEETTTVSSVEFTCGACCELLERPMVLNCGHAICSSCMQPGSRPNGCPSAPPLCCPTCGAQQPPTKLEVCVPLHELIERLFPQLAQQRREARRLQSGKAQATPAKEVVSGGASTGEGRVLAGQVGDGRGRGQGAGVKATGSSGGVGMRREGAEGSDGGEEGGRGGGRGEEVQEHNGAGRSESQECTARGAYGQGDDVAARDWRQEEAQPGLVHDRDENFRSARVTQGAAAGESATAKCHSACGAKGASEQYGPMNEMTVVQRAWAQLIAAQMRLRAAKSPEEEEELTAKLEEIRRDNYVHMGVGCDGCGAYPIVGRRFRCEDCPEAIGFDLCLDCHHQPGLVIGRFNQRHKKSHRMEEMAQEETLYTRFFQNVPEIRPSELMRMLQEMADSDDEGSMEAEQEMGRWFDRQEAGLSRPEAGDGRQVADEDVAVVSRGGIRPRQGEEAQEQEVVVGGARGARDLGDVVDPPGPSVGHAGIEPEE